MQNTTYFVTAIGVVSFIALVAVVGYLKLAPQKTITEGSYYAVRRDKKPGYNVLKILKIDEHGYHIRLYSNVFANIPKAVNVTELKIVGIDKETQNQDMGMGHLPINKSNLVSWNIIFIQKGTIEEAELEGYQIWKETNGGYF